MRQQHRLSHLDEAAEREATLRRRVAQLEQGAHVHPRTAITGSLSDGTALASLIAALVALGLVTDETTP